MDRAGRLSARWLVGARVKLTAATGACYRRLVMTLRALLPCAAMAVSLFALASPAPAIAATGSVYVLKVQHPGLDAALVSAFDRAVLEAVGRALPDHEVVPASLDFASIQLTAGCMEDGPECLDAIARSAKAKRLVRVVLRGQARRLTMEITTLKVGGKPELVRAELTDADSDSAPQLGWHVENALGGNPAALPGTISLLSGRMGSLEGAEIFLDDKKVPASALARIEAGSHRLEVHQRGFETFLWIGDVRPGRDTPVRVEFAPKQAPPPPVVAKAPPPPAGVVAPAPPPEGGSGLVYTWVFGAGAVIAGATGLVLGLTVLDLEDQAFESGADCKAMPNLAVCDDGRQRATLANVAYVAAGGLFVAAVVAFFVEDGFTVAGSRGDDTVELGIVPSRGGAAASLGLRF